MTEVDVLIAGGGIAGASAALTAARLGWKTLVLTGDILGGQLVSIESVEGYPGFPDGVPGYDLCPMAQEQAEAAGAEYLMTRLEKLAARDGKWLVTSGEGDFTARAIILATGSSLRHLGVPGEERLFGKGVSRCAGCDAPLLRGKIAAVVGGGDSAMQEALVLAEHVGRVIILQRGAALTGQTSYRDRVNANPKIETRFGVSVEEILGDDGVVGARIRETSTNATSEIPVDALFAYIGLKPNTDFAAGLIALDAQGYIPTDASTRTLLSGVCAAGNVRRGSSMRAVGAAGDGALAATAIDRYLRDGVWREG